VRVRALVVTLALVFVGITGGRAHAEPIAAPDPLSESIGLERGATCLEEARLEAQVRAFMGRDPFPRGVRIFVRGDATNPRAVAFKFVREGRIRERRFDPTPAPCEEAHAVVALAIALAVDADLLKRVVDLAAPEPPPPNQLTLQGAAGYQVVPGVSLGGSLGVDHRWLEWLHGRTGVFAQHSFANHVEGSRGTFDATLVAADLGACTGGDALGGFRLSLCVGVAGGALNVRGSGFTVSRSATGLWVAAESGLRMAFGRTVPWILDVMLTSPLSVPAVRVEEAGAPDRYRAPDAIGLLVSLGPGLSF
jgi:hypothetical protein